MADAAATLGAAGDRLGARARGTQGKLFGLVLGTSLLSVVTLGLYSFWHRTRVRRWLWSSLEVGGAPFEYVGRPLEKLTGFVFAAVLIGVWLGVVTMILVWASLNLFLSPLPGALATAALIVPVWLWAQYRGMRYLLGHTLWRGIAFRMEPGAWGYMLRALLWGAATLLTLGLLEPLRRRALWRYRVERTWWGDARLAFAARAGDLYRVFLPVLASLLAIVAIGVGLSIEASGQRGAPSGSGVFVLILAVLGAIVLWVRWKVRSWAILASGIRLEGGAALTAAPRTGRVIGIHLLGALATSMILGVLFYAIAAVVGIGAFATLEAGGPLDPDDLPVGWIVAGFVAAYLALYVLRGAFRMVFVTFPLIRHVADTMVVTDAARLDAVRRGEGDFMADADGFANLFDTGAGI